MSEKRRVLVGTAYALASTVVALLVALLLRPIMVFYLGIEDYGILVLASTIMGVLALVSDLGLGGALTKFVSEEKVETRRNQLITSALAASFLLGFVATVLILAVAHQAGYLFGIPALAPILQIMAWQVPFTLATLTCLAAVNGLRWTRFYGLGVMFTNVSSFGLNVGALALGGGVLGLVYSILAAAVLNLAVLVFAMRRVLVRVPLSQVIPDFRRLVVFGIQLSGTNVLSSLLYQIDTIILGLVTKSNALVGYYNIATVFARTLWIVPGSVAVVAYPAFSEYRRERKIARIQALVDRALRFSSATIGLALIGFVYFGRDILTLLFGVGGISSYEPLLILLFGAGTLGLSRSIVVGLPGAGRPDLGLKIVACGLALSAVLNVVLVGALSMIGAALATSIAYAAVAILSLHYTKRVLGIRMAWKWHAGVLGLAATLAALGLTTGLVFPSAAPIRWLLGALALACLSTLLYVRFLGSEDIRFVVSVVRQTIRRPRMRDEMMP